MIGVKVNKTYTPIEIANLGLIGWQKSASSRYQFILKEIKAGRLKATSLYPTAVKTKYLVSDKAVHKYLKKYFY
jgi:hypothetical protein